MRELAAIFEGQSNLQGSAHRVHGPRIGSTIDRARSIRTGETDPFPGCNNVGQGGSMFPFLIDMMWARGIRLHVFNYAIGGASVFQYTGRLGATIASPTVPASVGYFSGGEMTGGTTIQRFGDPNWDPFGLQARAGAEVLRCLGKYDAVISAWSNGESDYGISAASYEAGVGSVADYMIGLGVDRHFIGLTCKVPTATTGNMQLLQQGVAAAIASRPKCSAGADMFAYHGDNPPLYPETGGGPYVHYYLRGQYHHALAWNAKFQAAGY